LDESYYWLLLKSCLLFNQLSSEAAQFLLFTSSSAAVTQVKTTSSLGHGTGARSLGLQQSNF
jgi:hypothetical protein